MRWSAATRRTAPCPLRLLKRFQREDQVLISWIRDLKKLIFQHGTDETGSETAPIVLTTPSRETKTSLFERRLSAAKEFCGCSIGDSKKPAAIILVRSKICKNAPMRMAF